MWNESYSGVEIVVLKNKTSEILKTKKQCISAKGKNLKKQQLKK